MSAYYLIRESSLGYLVSIASERGILWAGLAATFAQAWDQLQTQGLQQQAYRLPNTAAASLRPWEDLPPFPRLWSDALWGALEQPDQLWRAPLDLTGTPFQQAVWQVLQQIPPGRLMRYGQIAALVGRSRAARAVGSACGANPVPFLVPCHRVIAHHGQLGGFGLGLTLKKTLLQREGIDLQRLAEYEIPDAMSKAQSPLLKLGKGPVFGTR